MIQVIDLYTQLRGPLAEQLLRVADKTGKPPVDALADLLERALSGVEPDDVERRLESRIAELKEGNRKLREMIAEQHKVERRLSEQVGRLQETIKSRPALSHNLSLDLPPSILKQLQDAAAQRNYTLENLVGSLLTMIVQDNLVDGVLDE